MSNTNGGARRRRHGDGDRVRADLRDPPAPRMDERLARRQRDADQAPLGAGLDVRRQQAEVVGVVHRGERDALLGGAGDQLLDRREPDRRAEPAAAVDDERRRRRPRKLRRCRRIGEAALDALGDHRQALEAVRGVAAEIALEQPARLHLGIARRALRAPRARRGSAGARPRRRSSARAVPAAPPRECGRPRPAGGRHAHDGNIAPPARGGDGAASAAERWPARASTLRPAGPRRGTTRVPATTTTPRRHGPDPDDTHRQPDQAASAGRADDGRPARRRRGAGRARPRDRGRGRGGGPRSRSRSGST